MTALDRELLNHVGLTPVAKRQRSVSVSSL